MWRHNDVIGRNEYLISTFQNPPFFRYIHCNFCLNLHITHGDMKENVSGCFFSEHSVCSAKLWSNPLIPLWLLSITKHTWQVMTTWYMSCCSRSNADEMTLNSLWPSCTSWNLMADWSSRRQLTTALKALSRSVTETYAIKLSAWTFSETDTRVQSTLSVLMTITGAISLSSVTSTTTDAYVVSRRPVAGLSDAITARV